MGQASRIALISLGSNAHHRQSDLASIIQKGSIAVAKKFDDAEALTSRLYATPAYPPGIGPDFVNAALTVRTELSPAEILESLHQIEASFGRVRTVRWGPRILDLDLLGVSDLILPDAATFAAWMTLSAENQTQKWPDQLILPHPRLQDRAFVLVPLAEIAPDWMHPVLGRTVLEMRDALPTADLDQIVPLAL